MKHIKRTIFECEHCKKKYIVASTCKHHEDICKKNPLNMHPCFECKNLKRIEVELYPYDIGIPVFCKSYKCSVKDIGLYSRKAVVNRHYVTLTESESIAHELMPTSCADFCEKKDQFAIPILANGNEFPWQ